MVRLCSTSSAYLDFVGIFVSSLDFISPPVSTVSESITYPNQKPYCIGVDKFLSTVQIQG